MPSSTASLKGQPKHAKMAEQFFFPSLLSMTDDLYSNHLWSTGEYCPVMGQIARTVV